MNKQKTLIFSLSAMLFLTASFLVYSWSEPETTMPGTYTPPINTSATAQTKSGDLSATSFVDANDSNYYLNPSGKSVVSGTIVAGYPTESNELATKQYVEDALVGFIPPAGGEPGDIIVMGQNGPIWVTTLSYKNSTGSGKNAYDCDEIGGIPYDTGEGIICRVQSSIVPSGWYQVESWQRYSQAQFDGDSCGNHKGSAPIVWGNNTSYFNYAGSTHTVNSIHWNSCSFCESDSSCWWSVASSTNVSNYRVEIGIY